jgi:hypothetical protein
VDQTPSLSSFLLTRHLTSKHSLFYWITRTRMGHPKLPPLRSKDIEWDVDDSDMRPHPTRNVYRSQTLPSRPEKPSGVYLDGDAVRWKT